MATEPETRAISLPDNCTWRDPKDPPWPTPEDPDQILTHTTARKAIVCCPQLQIPSIERGSPHFTICTTSTTATESGIADVLDAIRTHCDPVAPCYYGVRHKYVQAYGRGVRQFKRTLTDPLDDAPALTPPPQRTPAPDHVGSCCWQTESGWVIVEAHRDSVTDDATFQIRVGLMMLGPLTRPETVEPVFKAVGESLPGMQKTWPLRQLILTRDRRPPTESVAEETLGTAGDTRRLQIHGGNPLYGTQSDDLQALPTTLRDTMFTPLSRVSTLVYTTEGRTSPHRSTLTVVEPPLMRTLFVAGTVQRTT